MDNCSCLTKASGFTNGTSHAWIFQISDTSAVGSSVPTSQTRGQELRAPRNLQRSRILCEADLRTTTSKVRSPHSYNPEGAPSTINPHANKSSLLYQPPLKGQRGVELPGNRSASPDAGKEFLGQAGSFLRQPSLCDSGGDLLQAR